MDNNCIILSIILLSAILYIFVINNSNKENYRSFRANRTSPKLVCHPKRSEMTYRLANMLEKRGTTLRSNGSICNLDIDCTSRFCNNNKCSDRCVSKSAINNIFKR